MPYPDWELVPVPGSHKQGTLRVWLGEQGRNIYSEILEIRGRMRGRTAVYDLIQQITQAMPTAERPHLHTNS